MSRRPYVREVRRAWWLGQPRYVVYMIRELTSLFIGFYSAWLVIGLVRLAQGRTAWEGFLAATSSPSAVLFQFVCLVFAAYHSITWFAVTPKAMPLTLQGKPVSGNVIVAGHYAAWALVSLVVLIAAGV